MIIDIDQLQNHGRRLSIASMWAVEETMPDTGDRYWCCRYRQTPCCRVLDRCSMLWTSSLVLSMLMLILTILILVCSLGHEEDSGQDQRSQRGLFIHKHSMCTGFLWRHPCLLDQSRQDQGRCYQAQPFRDQLCHCLRVRPTTQEGHSHLHWEQEPWHYSRRWIYHYEHLWSIHLSQWNLARLSRIRVAEPIFLGLWWISLWENPDGPYALCYLSIAKGEVGPDIFDLVVN